MSAINRIRISGVTYDIGASGGGVTSGEVETMISAATSGYTERFAEDEEVTAAGLNALNDALSGKQDTLIAGTNITISGNVISSSGGGGSGSSTVELTQEQYDALVSGGTVDPTTYYIITDATPIDISNYWTSAQTQSAITNAVSGKQDTLVSGTNIKTINNESILGSGNITIQGGGITSGEVQTMIDESVSGKQDTLSAGTGISIVDNVISATGGGGVNVVQTTGTSTTDVMSQDAVTTAINTVSGAIPSTYVSTIAADTDQGYQRFYRFSTPSNFNYFILNNAKINNRAILSTSWGGFNTYFSLVETSAVTSSVTSASTDAQIPSAKAVYDAIGQGGGGAASSAITSGDTNAVAGGAVYDKFDEVESVTAAALNNLNDKFDEVESVTAAGLNALNDKFGGLKLQQITQSAYDALVSGGTVDSSTLYIITNVV